MRQEGMRMGARRPKIERKRLKKTGDRRPKTEDGSTKLEARSRLPADRQGRPFTFYRLAPELVEGYLLPFTIHSTILPHRWCLSSVFGLRASSSRFPVFPLHQSPSFNLLNFFQSSVFGLPSSVSPLPSIFFLRASGSALPAFLQLFQPVKRPLFGQLNFNNLHSDEVYQNLFGFLA